MRFIEHQVLLLQQLQSYSAAALLQDVPPLLDQRRCSPERPHRRGMPEEQDHRRVELGGGQDNLNQDENHGV